MVIGTTDGAAEGAGAALEGAYFAGPDRAHRRRYSQHLTPPDCAALMADWVAGGAPRRLLDPALGTGRLAAAVLARCPDAQLEAHELDPAIAAVARQVLAPWAARLCLRLGDFLAEPGQAPIDAVIANPPWQRQRHLPGARAAITATGTAAGLKLAATTNGYALFLIRACLRLRPGGRGAFLLPAEWSGANFAGPLKRFLLERGLLRGLVQIASERAVFGDALTTACLLLIEAGGDPARPLRSAFVPEGAALPDLATLFGPAGARNGLVLRDLDPAVLAAAPTWEPLLRGAAPRWPAGFVRLGALAGTRRGLATGANAFFLLDAAQAAGLAPEDLRPCIGRAADAPGLVLDATGLAALQAAGRPAWLFSPRLPLDGAAAARVAAGEAAGYHRRHLTAARRPWFATEAHRVAPILAAVFGRGAMRFLRNDAGAVTLTVFHGIYPHDPDPGFADALTACLCAAPVQALIAERVRIYGGGLQKLEPRDLLEVPVPDLSRLAPARIARLAAAFRALAAAPDTAETADPPAPRRGRKRVAGPGRGAERAALEAEVAAVIATLACPSA